MERTLSIVKPDGTNKNVIGEVIARYEKNGLRVAALRMIRMSKEQAEGFYFVHRERPFFGKSTGLPTKRRVDCAHQVLTLRLVASLLNPPYDFVKSGMR